MLLKSHASFIVHLAAALLFISAMATASPDCCDHDESIAEYSLTASSMESLTLAAESASHSDSCCDEPCGSCALPCCAASPGAIFGLMTIAHHDVIATRLLIESQSIPSGPSSDIFHPPQA